MAISMTGFGRGEAKGKWGAVVIEARSLNHRYLEVSSRFPSSLQSLEDRVRDLLSKKIRRGRVTLSISFEKDGELGGLARVDEKKAKRYYEILSSLKKDLGLKGEVELGDLLSLPDVVRVETNSSEIEEIWSQVREALEKAVSQFGERGRRKGRR